MNLYIVRHGQTNGNIERIMDGCRRDIPLNETGTQQAIKARENIKDINFDLVICSPLIRTRQTMELITENRFPVIYEKEILERDCGEFTGKSFDSLDRDLYWNYNDTTQYESAENIKDFFKRIHNYLDNLKSKYKEKTILLVTHGGVTKAIDCYFQGIPSDGSLKNVGLGNCEIKHFSILFKHYSNKNR